VPRLFQEEASPTQVNINRKTINEVSMGLNDPFFIIAGTVLVPVIFI